MRSFIFSIAILATQLNSVHAQIMTGSVGQIRTGMPLVLVDTLKTDLNLLVLNPENIESIHIYKDSIAISKFGDAGKFGAILIHPKADVRLLRIDKILDNSKLSIEDKKLRICINKTLVLDPQLILIENSEIVSVEVTKERNWVNAEDANSGERFINITTKTKRKGDL